MRGISFSEEFRIPGTGLSEYGRGQDDMCGSNVYISLESPFRRETCKRVLCVRFTVLDRLRRRTPDPPDFNPDRVPDNPRRTVVDAADGTYTCHAVDSPDRYWTLAYGRRQDGERSRLFGICDDDIAVTASAVRPSAGAVANDGAMAVVERGGSDSTVDRLRVLVDGVETLCRSVDATIADVAITPDGRIAAIATRQPDTQVRVFDADSGEPLWHFAPQRITPRLLGFHGEDTLLLYVARAPRDEPYLALTLNGNVSWGNERYQSTRPIRERVRSLISRG